MKRALALAIVLVMLLTLIACNGDDEKIPASDSEETTTEPTDNQGDETPDDPNQGGNENQGGNQGGENQGGNQGGNENQIQPTPPPEGKDFVLVNDGVAQFAIVSKNKAYGYDTMATNFANALSGKTSTQFTVKKSASSSEKALFIGAEPSSFLSAAELLWLTYDGYLLREINGNIHLTAYTKEGVQRALDELVNAITEETMTMNGTKLSVTIPGSTLTIYNPEYTMRNATLLGKPISDFEIVLPKDYSVIERFAAENLIAQIGHDTGYKLEYVKDSAKPSKPYRIVLGETSLEQSVTLYGDLAANSCRIKSIGNDIYVAYENYLVSMEIQTSVRELYSADSSAAIDVNKSFDYSDYKLEKSVAEAKNPNKVVRIMTSNIVAPGDENGQKDIEKKYGVTWQDRMKIQGEAIMTYLPDFIGFQELQQGDVNGVRAFAHTELLKTIGEEYAFVYYDEVSKASHFTPIAYRKNVWTVVEKAASANLSTNHMHRWQWALFAMIDDPATTEDESEIQYIIINLHYPISSMTTERDKAGKEVNAEFKRLKELYPDIPISITGDFNAAYSTPLFNLTVGAKEDGTADTDLKTSYMATTNKNGPASIDHILVEDDDVTVFNYRVLGDAYIRKTSDHSPVVADIHIGKIVPSTPGPEIPWGDGTVQP